MMLPTCPRDHVHQEAEVLVGLNPDHLGLVHAPVQYSTVQYSNVQYSAVQYSTDL